MTDLERRVLRWVLRVGAVLVGVGLSGAHWLGIVAGGALVGVLSSTVRRGVLAGATFGLLVWIVFAGTLFVDGAIDRFLATGGFAAISAAIAVGLGAFGGLARGLR